MALAYYLHIPRRQRRSCIQFLIYAPLLFFFWIGTRYLRCTASGHTRCWTRTWDMNAQIVRPFDREARLTVEESRQAFSKHVEGAPTVNLVVASVVGDDISWIQRVQIPNMAVVRYYSDDPNSKYHPPVPKGREALMYHTYFYDFYDNLPDISIFIHAHEAPWHLEPVLQTNLSFALNMLDLSEVERREYLSLRIMWQGACPDWINMTKTPEEMDEEKLEEPYMKRFWVENFDTPESELPEIVAQPCCSQFAVTKKAIQATPRENYKRYQDWLADTTLIDFISGRFWEHSFQYIFTGRYVDCPVEYKAYCRTYRICFESSEQLEEHMSVEWEREWLLEDLTPHQRWRHPGVAREALKKLSELDPWLAYSRNAAIERGRDQSWVDGLGDLYKW